MCYSSLKWLNGAHCYMVLDDVYSRVSGQPDYHQGEVVEPGECIIPV